MLALTSTPSVTLIILGLVSLCWTAPASLSPRQDASQPSGQSSSQSGSRLSQTIISNAGGGLSDAPNPKNISQNAIDGFTVANFIENVEAAFFTQALANLTSDSSFTK